MKQRTRIYYSDAQKAQMLDLWQLGESTHKSPSIHIGGSPAFPG